MRGRWRAEWSGARRLGALLVILGGGLAGVAALAEDLVPGVWTRQEIPATGSYVLRYLPPDLDLGRPVPVVVFFHGAAGMPEAYEGIVRQAAREVGVVALLPRSQALGWGALNDLRTVEESLRLLRLEVTVDEAHIAFAGHSAGGAFAYLLAYGTLSRASAVFSMSAPFVPVPEVVDPAYRAPIHMYYGSLDPNYSGGDARRLEEQWEALGLEWSTDVQERFGHNTWPRQSVVDGFAFLLAHAYEPASGCEPTAERLCLGGGRYQVEVRFDAGDGGEASARVAGEARAADSGLFWFFDPANWELLLKVLDGCAVNDHVWVFTAGTTNVGYRVEVTDLATGAGWTTENPPRQLARTVTDTLALPCP